MIILKITVCLTSTGTLRIKCLCDRVSAFAPEQEEIAKEFTLSLFLNSFNYYKA